MKRAWWIALLVPGLVHATPENLKAFTAHYGIKATSRIGKTSCTTCHFEAKFPARDPYGRALQSKQPPEERVISATTMIAVETEDSDGDGFTNLEEIKADTLPGDPKSHPAGNPKPVAPPAEASTELIPKHSFHPAVVHFPIALFLFGVMLEVWGMWRRPEARLAARYVLIGGALATLITIPTGLAVFLRSGFKWEGTALIHFILALVATALMAWVAIWRAKSEPTSIAYWVLLLLAGATVAAAGHFGGVLVYGS